MLWIFFINFIKSKNEYFTEYYGGMNMDMCLFCEIQSIKTSLVLKCSYYMTLQSRHPGSSTTEIVTKQDGLMT